MPHISNNSQVSFLHNFTAVFEVVVYLSTMQFGNLLSSLKKHLTGLNSNPSSERILIAQRRLLIYLKKLQYQGFVLISNVQDYNI